MADRFKAAGVTLDSLNQFIQKAETALCKFIQLRNKLKEDAFKKKWNENAAAELRDLGINPDLRMDPARKDSARGSGCDFCITQDGEPCVL